MENSYEKTYEAIVHKLTECNLAEATVRLGIDPPVNGTAKINFLGREYLISSSGVVASDGMHSDPNARSTLVYYITSKGNAEPVYSYSLPHRFIPGPIAGVGSSTLSWMTAPVVSEFEKELGRLDGILQKLGATREQSNCEDEHIWAYAILPKIPMRIIYLEGDDEFPDEIKLMLDNNAGKFMEFEQLAFLCGCFVNTVLKMGRLDER